MARIRTFIGVEIGKTIRERAVALQEILARASTEVKWVEPENLHVTLLFLGEVEDREVARVCKIVADCAQNERAFPMTVATVGCFPNPHRPRIVWIGIGEGAQALCRIHDAMELPLLELGYRREERRYTPHITLGRVKSDRPPDQFSSALAKKAGWQGGDITVTEILIMSSELTPQGPKYTILGRAPLG
ncbi:MAG TPA: RNA 2',3'-cyclic phosphodiesterase [Gemmataceae bacterium]|jgi:2'-5' RNA ligase|nr:RNA 2',3'-cyclic phosphodiesterase [Gemmataceae bacterium]